MNFPFSFRRKAVQTKKVISDNRIELQFDVEKPVDLVDLTLAFQAFHRQYSKFVTAYFKEKNIEIPDDDSVRLFVTKIESNCVSAELAWVDPTTLFVGTMIWMDNANTICEFLKNLTGYLDFFRGKIDLPDDKKPSRKDCQDFRELLEPVASAGKGSFKYNCAKYDKNGNKTIEAAVEFVSDDVFKAVSAIDSRIGLLESKSTADHQNVLLSLETVQEKIQKPDAKRTRDFGVIERICSKPLPVYWASELDQQKVKNHPFPFKMSLMVDVNVEAKHGEPKAFHVVKLNDILDD